MRATYHFSNLDKDMLPVTSAPLSDRVLSAAGLPTRAKNESILFITNNPPARASLQLVRLIVYQQRAQHFIVFPMKILIYL